MKNGNSKHGDETCVVKAKPTNASLKEILLQYGYALYVCGFVGSFAVTPCVAVSPTMFTVSLIFAVLFWKKLVPEPHIL